jgi:predicted nucleic acid-binding protein
MKNHLFDSSSFISLIKKANPHIVADCLRESSVLNLTFYEVGNVVWKENCLTKTLSPTDVETLQTMAPKLLAATNRITSEPEDFQKILEIAKKEKLTFYDSSYIYQAQKQGLTLVTEDKELRAKGQKYLEAKSTSILLTQIESPNTTIKKRDYFP